jgi:hypothetical protein
VSVGSPTSYTVAYTIDKKTIQDNYYAEVGESRTCSFEATIYAKVVLCKWKSILVLMKYHSSKHANKDRIDHNHKGYA